MCARGHDTVGIDPTSVDDAEQVLSINPCPSTGLVSINLNGCCPQGGNLLVHDVSGRLIERLYLEPATSTRTLDSRDYPAGIYSISVEGSFEVPAVLVVL